VIPAANWNSITEGTYVPSLAFTNFNACQSDWLRPDSQRWEYLMPFSFRAILSTATIACGLSSDLHAADLEEAKRQLVEWQQSFQSIRIKARISSEAATNYVYEGSDATKGWSDFDWTWEASGRFRFDETGGNDTGHSSRNFRVANLAYHYLSAFDGDSEFAKTVTIQRPSPPGQIVHDGPLWILWVSGTHSWLSDRIMKVTDAVVTTDGKLQVSGEALGYAAPSEASNFDVILDPQHGYLPLSVHYEQLDYDRYTVDEFQEVQPGFWFPKRGKIFMAVMLEGQRREFLQSWKVSEVELDPELPDSWFVPPMNDDTVVTNQFTGQKYRYGDPDTLITNEVPRYRPSEPESNPWPMRLLFVAGLCGVFVLLLRGSIGRKTPPAM